MYNHTIESHILVVTPYIFLNSKQYFLAHPSSMHVIHALYP